MIFYSSSQFVANDSSSYIFTLESIVHMYTHTRSKSHFLYPFIWLYPWLTVYREQCCYQPGEAGICFKQSILYNVVTSDLSSTCPGHSESPWPPFLSALTSPRTFPHFPSQPPHVHLHTPAFLSSRSHFSVPDPRKFSPSTCSFFQSIILPWLLPPYCLAQSVTTFVVVCCPPLLLRVTLQ